jgi:hypothetical protein
LLKADVFEGYMEQAAELEIRQRAVVSLNQEVRTLIISQHGLTYREVVFDLCDNAFWEGDESVLTELGSFDIYRGIIKTIVVSLQSERLTDPHATPGQEKHCRV